MCTRVAVCAIIVATLTPGGCSPNEPPPDTDRTSATGRPAVAGTSADTLLVIGGPVTRDSDEVALRRIFGDANVRQERIQIGEGETLPGTVLFPDDFARQLM